MKVEVSTQVAVARVLIADDQALFRSGLARLLEGDPRVHVIGQAVDGLDVVKKATSLKPDVVLMDLKMPNLDGVEATKRIVAEPRCISARAPSSAQSMSPVVMGRFTRA